MRQLNLGKTLFALTLATLAACQGRCGHSKPPLDGPEIADSTAPTFSAQAVSYCWEKSVVPSARVQLLIDASGSMNGFTASAGELVSWVEHAISGLRGRSLELASLNTCQFNRQSGLFACVPAISLGEYRPAGETNLHEAIRSALNEDLTFILTDGVAATGTGEVGDCASGVDAACVARALSEAVRPESGAGENSPSVSGPNDDPGIWIVPVVTAFSGRFYSEESIPLDEFEPAATVAEVNLQLARQETRVEDERLGSDGRLNFYYVGPRALFLIVIARQQKLGRDAVWSLWNQTPLRGVERLAEMKDFSTGIGSLQPIEVYPGFLNRLLFEKLQPTDEPNEHQGTLDVKLIPGDPRSSIHVDCPLGASGKGVYILRSTQLDQGRSSSCVPIQQLPAHSLRLEASSGGSDQQALDAIIRDYRQEGNEGTLRLDLICGTAPRRPCDSNPLPFHWNVLRDYSRTSAAIASGESSGAALATVLQISSTRPSREPHRVYGLAATLQAFYDLETENARRLALSDLEICNGSEP